MRKLEGRMDKIEGRMQRMEKCLEKIVEMLEKGGASGGSDVRVKEEGMSQESGEFMVSITY